VFLKANSLPINPVEEDLRAFLNRFLSTICVYLWFSLAIFVYLFLSLVKNEF